MNFSMTSGCRHPHVQCSAAGSVPTGSCKQFNIYPHAPLLPPAAPQAPPAAGPPQQTQACPKTFTAITHKSHAHLRHLFCQQLHRHLQTGACTRVAALRKTYSTHTRSTCAPAPPPLPAAPRALPAAEPPQSAMPHCHAGWTHLQQAAQQAGVQQAAGCSKRCSRWYNRQATEQVLQQVVQQTAQQVQSIDTGSRQAAGRNNNNKGVP